jgi:cytochrome c oxidase subunit 6a
MNTQRLGQRLGRQFRSPAFRSTFQRRFASEKTELRGVADNAFNRERAAVKAHAAATSGMYSRNPHV